MKLNSNTFELEGNTREYHNIVNILKKVASDNNINNVDRIQLELTQKEGIARFIIAEDTEDSNNVLDQTKQQQNSKQPNTQQPNTQQPNTQQPNTQQPNTQQLGNQQPNNQQLGDQQPNTQQLGDQQSETQQQDTTISDESSDMEQGKSENGKETEEDKKEDPLKAIQEQYEKSQKELQNGNPEWLNELDALADQAQSKREQSQEGQNSVV